MAWAGSHSRITEVFDDPLHHPGVGHDPSVAKTMRRIQRQMREALANSQGILMRNDAIILVVDHQDL
jgi:hypothetical protein